MSIAQSEIRDALSNILRSNSISSSPQLMAFLKFVVEETIQGNADRLKAYTIATSALGRPQSFDPQTDPIVRVQARRLRMTLDQYYLREGSQDKIKIDLVPGSYVPNFVCDEQSSRSLGASDDGKLTILPEQHTAASGMSKFNSSANDAIATPNRMLVLDDDPDIRSIIREIGECEGYTVIDTENANEFWIAYRALQPNLIVLDLVIPCTDGVEILRELAQLESNCRIALISGMDTRVLTSTQRLGRELGLDIIGTITKPFDFDEVSKLLQPSSGTDDSITVEQLSAAIERGELILHYQPKIGLADGVRDRLVGFEGLVRWQCPNRGLVPPKQLIPLAEKAGLIKALTDEVIRIGIGQLAQWSACYPSLTLAINLSAVQMTDLSLPDQLEELLDAENVAPDRLVIEITEATALDVSCETADILARFRLKGFQLSIDDFGTGCSSLMGLFKTPFNEIIIDKSVVFDLETDEEAKAIVAAILGLAKSIGLTSCAKGVESQECAAILAQLGCDVVQGYLYSKPVPADKLSKIIDTYHKPLDAKLASFA